MYAQKGSVRLFVLAHAIAAALIVAGALPLKASVAGETRALSATQPQQVQFVELLWLQPKATADAAADYFKHKLRPILAKHGGEIVQSYQVVASMKGDLTPAWINVIRFRSMEDMQAIFKDPEYAKLVPLRDSIFDLPQQRLFSVVPVAP